MQSFPAVPAAEHLGIDLKSRLAWSAYSLGVEKQIPDADGSIYPPFTNLLSTPLLAVKFSTAYALITLLSVLLYLFMTLWLPLLIRGERTVAPLAVLICTTGLLSYGFQFELERGQFNVIAFSLAFLAIYLHSRHPRYRFMAYALFVISVQLKLYSIVFIVLLISDWDDWKRSAMRILFILLVNVALFFVQGPRMFGLWIAGLRDWAQNTYIWVGNPSIKSAVGLASHFAARRGWTWFLEGANFVEVFLLVTVVVCLCLILLHVYRQRSGGISPYFLLAGAIGCLLVPSGGYDYRLSIFGAPMVVLLLAETRAETTTRILPSNMIRKLALMTLSLAYSSTLFSFSQKPYYLANNLPALLVMLLAVTYLALSSERLQAGPSI